MVAAGVSLVNLVLDVLVGLITLEGGLREAVVVPPVDKGGDGGDAGGDELLHGRALDGQRRLSERAENLVGQCQQQGGSASNGSSGNLVVVLNGLVPFFYSIIALMPQRETASRCACLTLEA